MVTTNTDTTTPFFYKNIDNAPTTRTHKPVVRNPENENFWMNASYEKKLSKVVKIVNKALAGDLFFISYEDYRKWLKRALSICNKPIDVVND